jgi:nucleoside-diphosphate-sugar epimerase
MKILVLGGSGFVSGAMARFGAAHGHRVHTLSRGKKAVLAGEGITALTADRNEAGAFAAAIAGAETTWDLVIDCIGFTAEHARQDLDVFGGGGGGGVRAKQLLFLSSDFACSPVDRPWRIDESFDRFDPAPYGAAKRAAEEVLLANTTEMGVTVLRPCHIYGPGSLLGCIPLHGRDPQLIERIRQGETLKLLAGGVYLQQPIFVEDLCAMAYACVGNANVRNELFFVAGPEIVESQTFYKVIGELLGVPVTIGEAAVEPYLAANPEHRAFCCHRVYSREKAERAGLPLPATGLREGLRRHLQSMGAL